MSEPTHDHTPGEPAAPRPGTVYRARPGWKRMLGGGDGRRRPRAPRHEPDVTLVDVREQAPRSPVPTGVPGAPAAPVRIAGGSPPRVRRRPRLRLRGLLVLVVLLLVGYPTALAITAWTSLQRVHVAASSLPDTPGRTWLVVGSDSRDELSKQERRRLHTGSAGGRRTDTIMLLHIPSGGGPVALISLPRDSYVAIPGHGRNKINAAYAFGGPDLLARTVEQATGVRVDGYAETGLGGFAGIVDSVGGVRVCVKKPMKDAQAHIDLAAGCQTMDGPTALGYARARHSQARGDLDRVEHQRQVLAAIASRAMAPSVLLNPLRSFPVARAGGSALTVDDESSPMAVAGFVRAMRTIAGGDGVELTVPVSRADLETSAGLAVAWDRRGAAAVFSAVTADDTQRLRAVADEQRRGR